MRLRLPTQLVVTVMAAGCSDAAGGADAAVDAARDVSPGDRVDVVDVVDVVDAARACTPNPFDPENPAFAVRCRRRPGAMGTCPTMSVCVAADCPANCEGCVVPLFCIVDPLVDAGVACAGGTVCSAESCPPGCRAVS